MGCVLGAVLIREVLSVGNDRFGASDGHFVAISVDSFRKNPQVNYFLSDMVFSKWNSKFSFHHLSKMLH